MFVKYKNIVDLWAINPIQYGGQKAPPLYYQFFTCNFYKRRN